MHAVRRCFKRFGNANLGVKNGSGPRSFSVIQPPPYPGLAAPAMPMYHFGIEYIRSALMTLPCDTLGVWIIFEIDSSCPHIRVCLAPKVWT